MKKFRKLTALLLAVVMVLSMLPVLASAEEDVAAVDAVETAETEAIPLAESSEEEAPAAEEAAETTEEVTLQPEEQEEQLVGALDGSEDLTSVASGSDYVGNFTRSFTDEEKTQKDAGKLVVMTDSAGVYGYFETITQTDFAAFVKRGYADRVVKLLGDLTIDASVMATTTNGGVIEIPATNGNWGSANYSDLTFDLNGYTLAYAGAAALFSVRSGHGFTVENGNIDLSSATRSLLRASTGASGGSATSGKVHWEPTVNIERITMNIASNIVQSWIWKLTVNVDHCELISETTAFSLQGATGGNLPTSGTDKNTWKPSVTVSDSFIYSGATNTTGVFYFAKSTASSCTSTAPTLTITDSVCISKASGNQLYSSGFTSASGTYATTGCATRENASWSGTTFSGAAKTGYQYDIQSGWDITFDEDNGSAVSVTRVTHSANPTHSNPTKDGHTFSGWLCAADNVIYLPGEDLPTPAETGETTYTAQWVETSEETATVVFQNYNGSELLRGDVAVDSYPVYSGATPTRPTDADYVYTFDGWTDSNDVFYGGALAAVEEKDVTVTYTAHFSTATTPWYYIASDESVSYHATLKEAFAAYTADLANLGTGANGTAGTLKLRANYSVAADDNYANNATYTLNGIAKNLTIDLGGFTLTDATTRHFILADQDNAVITVKSSAAGKGTFTKTAGGNLVRITGTNNSATTATAQIDAYVVLDNVNVTTTTSNVIYGVAQRTHISFNDSNVTSSSQVFSLQGTNKWSGEQAAVYDLSFTDSSVQGSYIAYIAPYANSATAASRTATVTLGGENTFKYTDTKDGVPFYGFPYYTGTASSTRVALIDPANGYVQASEGYLPIVTLPTEAVGGVYTVSTNVEKAIKIEWDADGDGIVEKTEYVVSGATPAHEDGEKAPDTVNQIRYEFAGWLKNGAGDPITNLSAETVTEDVLYKAFFNSVAITKTYNITFDPNNGESVKVVATPEGVTPVYGTDPEKTSADKIYTFVGWSPDGGTTLYTADTLPTAQAEATYTAIYTSELIPWAYTASSSAVSYFVTLADAVAAHDADSGDGTIRMLRDYTNSSSVAVTKDTTIDLNGFTLTDSSGNNVFSLSGATPAVLTITSTGSNGKIVKSGARNIVAFGTSTGSVYPENAVGVTLENLTIDASGATAGQVNAAYLANVTYKLVNCEVNTAKPFFSFQSNAKWTSDMSAYWNFVFEDTQITSGDGIVYALTSATGTATPAESCHVSVKLGGSNTFKYKSYAAQYGFRYTPNGGSLTSLIVPANGYVSGTDGSAPIVTLPTGMEGGYYTIETISGIPVYWDTNNDGTYDDITGVNGTNPVHADGSKPFEAETKTQYTFIGWYDGETLYAPGDPIPVPTEAAYYTAKFTASVATGATAFYMDAAGVVTPLEGDVQALLATYGGAAKTFTLLDDYTLSADLNLYGVPVLDLGGYTLDGNYAINVTQDAEIKNGTVNVTGASAISATGGNLMLTDLTVHAQQIAVDLQAFGSINKLTNVSLYAGESLGSGYPALKVGAATAKTTVAGCFLVTGSADSPLIDAAASVEINSFEAYISDVYYADMDNYTWYYEAADGLVYALQWVVARGTETVPGTSFAGYHHVFASKPTAKIGSKYFGTLYEAVNAVVKTGGTVTLLHDTNVAEEIEAGAGTAVQYYYVDSAKGAVTIDLNGFTVYGSSTCRTFTLSGANPVTFMNGKLDLSNQGNTAGNYGVLLGAGGSTLRMINVDMVAQIRAIYLATGDVNKLVEIIGGSYTMTNTSAENGLVTFSINRTNPRASGNTLRISENAKFTRNAQYAIYMTELDTCEITSAEFHVAANGKAISEEDVTVYVNESQMTKTEEPASGTYIYKALEEQYVVENNGTKYFTLTDALAAAKSGDQLKVLRDFSEKLTNAVIPSTISISMNGHKVTFEAGSVVNGVTFPENRVIDTALNLKKVSLTIKDPLQMNLKFASSDLTVTAGDLVMNSITASGSYTAYSFIVEKTDFTKYYDVWATNGSAYGIPEKISVKRYADAAQSGSNQSLKDLTASLMNYGMNSSGYNSSEKYTGIDAYDKAVASEILSASADGFALTYVGEMTDVTVAYKDVYGMGVKPYMDGTTFNLASPANVLGQIVITDGSGTTETDTLMSALKASGSKYAAIYGYYAAQYFGN